MAGVALRRSPANNSCHLPGDLPGIFGQTEGIIARLRSLLKSGEKSLSAFKICDLLFPSNFGLEFDSRSQRFLRMIPVVCAEALPEWSPCRFKNRINHPCFDHPKQSVPHTLKTLIFLFCAPGSAGVWILPIFAFPRFTISFRFRVLRIWWNWQTRYFEVVVPQGVQVQVLLCAPFFFPVSNFSIPMILGQSGFSPV